jgi:hypothetical protein
MREAVQWFADMMEKTLLANDKKGGWKECSEGYLLCQLAENYAQILRTDGADKIKACVDVANYAMMIADNASGRWQEKG